MDGNRCVEAMWCWRGECRVMEAMDCLRSGCDSTCVDGDIVDVIVLVLMAMWCKRCGSYCVDGDGVLGRGSYTPNNHDLQHH